MEVERAAPCDRPHGRPVSETFMKEHHALSNWTNIVKKRRKKKLQRTGRAVLSICPNNRVHGATPSGEKANVS